MKRTACLLAVLSFPLQAAEPERVDCFGDPLPKGAIARMGTARLRHGGTVLAVAFSPDGKTLASGGADNVIRLWDPKTGRELRVLAGHKHWVHTLVYSPDGKRLVSISPDDTVRVWDPATGKELSCTKFEDKPFTAAFSRDGKVMAVGVNRTNIHIYDAATGKELRQWRNADYIAYNLAFSPDGKLLASGGSSSRPIRLWDWRTGKALHQVESVSPQNILDLAISPDSKTLAAGHTGGFDTWDVASGKKHPRFDDAESRVESVAFSPDGKRVAATGEDGLRVWDLATGKRLRSTQMRGHKIRAVAFSPDSKTLATGGGDGRVRLWEPAGDCDCRSLGDVHCEQILSLSLSPDGRTLATASEDATARLWDLSTGKPIHKLEKDGEVTCGPLFTVAFSPDGKLLATGQLRDGITLWDPGTGNVVREIKGHEGRVAHVAFSPDSKRLVSDGYDDKHIHLWDPATGKEIRRFAKGVNYGYWTAFTPDGRFLASLNDEGILHGWDLITGRKRALGKGPPSGRVIFSADGILVASSGNPRAPGKEWVCELLTGRQLFEKQAGFTCLAFAPGGRVFAGADIGYTVIICDTYTGKELRRLTGHRGTVHALAFTADGKRLVSAGKDCTALVWNVSDLVPPAEPANAEQLQTLWNELGVTEPNRSYRAFCDLIDQKERAVALVKDRVRPIPAVPPAPIPRLVAELDSNRFAVREKAAAELEKLGLQVEPLLRRALAEKPPLETRRRLELLLERMEKSSDWVRTQRAILLLSWIDTREARQVLEALAAGAPDAMPTREARQALQNPLRRSFR